MVDIMGILAMVDIMVTVDVVDGDSGHGRYHGDS